MLMKASRSACYRHDSVLRSPPALPHLLPPGSIAFSSLVQLGTHKRGKAKREEMSGLLRKMAAKK